MPFLPAAALLLALHPPPAPQPPVSPDDLRRFPPAWYARQAVGEADRHLEWVDAWITAWEQAPPSGYAKERLLEARHWRQNAVGRLRAWVWLRDAHLAARDCPAGLRGELEGLQRNLGPADYLGGRMPVPVPVELMGPRPPLFARPEP